MDLLTLLPSTNIRHVSHHQTRAEFIVERIRRDPVAGSYLTPTRGDIESITTEIARVKEVQEIERDRARQMQKIFNEHAGLEDAVTRLKRKHENVHETDLPEVDEVQIWSENVT